MKSEKKITPEILYRITDLFFDGVNVSKIRDCLKEEFEVEVTREYIYPLLTKARESGLIRLVPPLELELPERLGDKYGISKDKIHVVYTERKELNHMVSEKAAEIAFDRLLDFYRNDRPVGIGLGPGRASLDFCKALGSIMKHSSEALRVKLFAITAGCPATLPEFSPDSFFNLFPNGDRVMQKTGLFAENVVRANLLSKIKKNPGVKEAVKAKNNGEISFLVTSMGDYEDEHDILRQFQQESGFDRWKKEKWIGNVQYRPFDKNGPIIEKGKELRPVTLFELEELKSMAESKGKFVLLIARRCGLCGRSRANAVRPLLMNENLRVFSELVLDVSTARDLLL